VSVTQFGVRADGVTDDTVALQKSLTYCSDQSTVCSLPADSKVRITAPVFIWGGASLAGKSGSEILLDIEVLTDRFVVNLGLRTKGEAGTVFTGQIGGVTFRTLSGPRDKWLEDKSPIAGRIIQIWRAKQARIVNNRFQIGEYYYGAIGSLKHKEWLTGKKQYVREYLTIAHNQVIASSTAHGMEGMGVSYAKNVLFYRNVVRGVGDDIIGIHFSEGVRILENDLSGVDGRIMFANTSGAEIDGNLVRRQRSPVTGKFSRGQSLIAINYSRNTRVPQPRSKDVVISNNTLVYPKGSLDRGGAIMVRASVNIRIEANRIVNDSESSTVAGVWVAPVVIDRSKRRVKNYNRKRQQEQRDSKATNSTGEDIQSPLVSKAVKGTRQIDYLAVENIRIVRNHFSGVNPVGVKQTGRCDLYLGSFEVRGNEGANHSYSCSDSVSTDDVGVSPEVLDYHHMLWTYEQLRSNFR